MKIPPPLNRVIMAARSKVIWRRHALVRKLRVMQHELRYLFFEVTRRCNLACAYCGSDCTPRAGRSELSTAEWIQIARQIAEDFAPRKVMIAVTGGEPLMKEGIFDLFAEVEKLGFPWGMVSNGAFLDRAAADRLVAMNMRSISLSMDGPPAVNDALRGQGTSEGVVLAVKHLLDAGYHGKLEIMSTITKPVMPHLEEMRWFVGNLRVPLWRIVPVMPIGRAAKRPELIPSVEDLRKLLDFVMAARADGFRPVPTFCEEGFLGDKYEGRVRPYLCECPAGINTGGILCDGRIGACPELGEAYVQGDIRRERFKHVWETRYERLRDRSWTKQGACQNCAEYARCGGGSLHLYNHPGAEFLRCLHQMIGATK